jgi:hypothetical protein
MSSKPSTPPITLTLTLPDPDSERPTGTLLVQRGDLARLHQFVHTRIADLAEVIADALIAFAAVEANPPAVPQTPPPASAKKARPTTERKPQPPSEPTVEIPLKKGSRAVRISHLRITGGETDAAAYRQAVQIAALLIEGRLWDGETPIRIDDVYALAKRMKHLTPRDMSLFTLTDFVRVGAVEPATALDTPDDDADAPVTIAPPLELARSANGRHASDQTALL